MSWATQARPTTSETGRRLAFGDRSINSLKGYRLGQVASDLDLRGVFPDHAPYSRGSRIGDLPAHANRRGFQWIYHHLVDTLGLPASARCAYRTGPDMIEVRTWVTRKSGEHLEIAVYSDGRKYWDKRTTITKEQAIKAIDESE